jgi:hypothetical protein
VNGPGSNAMALALNSAAAKTLVATGFFIF